MAKDKTREAAIGFSRLAVSFQRLAYRNLVVCKMTYLAGIGNF
jgi:hypothetical protein